MMNNETRPDRKTANKYQEEQETRAAEPRPAPARNNPRFVVGGLDYFDLLMEQDEQQ